MPVDLISGILAKDVEVSENVALNNGINLSCLKDAQCN